MKIAGMFFMPESVLVMRVMMLSCLRLVVMSVMPLHRLVVGFYVSIYSVLLGGMAFALLPRVQAQGGQKEKSDCRRDGAPNPRFVV